MKKVLAALLTVSMAACLTACGSGAKENPAKEESTAEEVQAELEEEAAAENEEAEPGEAESGEAQQWGFIFEQLTNPNYVTMSGVAVEYGKENNIDIQIVDGQEDMETIVNAAENMATMGYQVILLSPMDVEIVATAASAAKAIKPDIIVVNSANAVEECDYSLLQDDYTSGVVCGEYAGQFILDNDLPHMVFTLTYPRDKALIDREEGFAEGIRGVVEDVEIIDSDWSTYDQTEWTGVCENLMTAHSECRVVYAISDIVMSYYYESLLASNQDTSEWALYSVDGTLDGVSWIYEESGFRGTADTGTLEIPTGLVDAALALQAGQTAEEIQVELPVTMITLDNVDEYAAKIGYEK